MMEVSAHLGQLVTIVIMAIALGLDAFSLGIGVGLKGIRLWDVLKISFVIALFHVLLPLLGMFAGHYMSSILGHVTSYVAGGLLLLLGGHMIYNSFKGDQVQFMNYRSLPGVILFSLSVSIDSFSVGISLGMFRSDLFFTVLAFGFFGGLMSVLGLLLGRTVSQGLGDYGEAAGGVILFTFGLLFIF
ncbi:manganese efflux pump [Paenibacillus sediminis]|uniref:Putative manganese efflux pump MntP n=1 Tax=Paenibacillus sediminis TaxID=664909 RepID=A0ABS4H2L7_9BACL|nr:manganese efflux pump [Paenibacillus sediminis]MBP1936711.1 putative Mn2+ efflux pump MntP [Paenibacillus sediminis]